MKRTELKRKTELVRKAPLKATPVERGPSETQAAPASSQRRPEIGTGARSSLNRQAPLKRSKGFEASPAQRAKVRDLHCIHCGRDRYEAKVDPHHLWPSCCDEPGAVVPLCRPCHREHHDGLIDLLPNLIPHWQAELGHAVSHAGLLPVLEYVTKQRWRPVDRSLYERAA